MILRRLYSYFQVPFQLVIISLCHLHVASVPFPELQSSVDVSSFMVDCDYDMVFGNSVISMKIVQCLV